jgi:hypothetical protein
MLTRARANQRCRAPEGSPPPDSAIYGLAAPNVLPPCCLRGTRQDLPCTSAGEPRTRERIPKRTVPLFIASGGLRLKDGPEMQEQPPSVSG